MPTLGPCWRKINLSLSQQKKTENVKKWIQAVGPLDMLLYTGIRRYRRRMGYAPTRIELAKNKSLSLSTKKEYRSISFGAIDPKILIMIDNYASYNKRHFWS